MERENPMNREQLAQESQQKERKNSLLDGLRFTDPEAKELAHQITISLNEDEHICGFEINGFDSEIYILTSESGSGGYDRCPLQPAAQRKLLKAALEKGWVDLESFQECAQNSIERRAFESKLEDLSRYEKIFPEGNEYIHRLQEQVVDEWDAFWKKQRDK